MSEERTTSTPLKIPSLPQDLLAHLLPCPGPGRQAPVPGGEAGHRPLHRRRLLLRYGLSLPLYPRDHGEIEGEMRKICKEKLKLERFELPREEAIKFMEEKGRAPTRWS